MRYAIRQERRATTNGLDGTVLVLSDTKAGERAEVWPALGFNAYRWQAEDTGKLIDVLYAAPNLFDDSRPTRSGIPVLFPFPNRIRDGRFTWDGKTYQLPLQDSTKKNSIHGFACRHPWRIVDQGANDDQAWVTGEFHAAKDAPEDLKLWPADHRIRLTIRLSEHRLRVSARIDNPDQKPLPFGLGYHPYFRTPLLPGARKEDCFVQVHASRFWELVDNLPTGKLEPVDAARNLTQPRRVTELSLDDVLRSDAAAQGDRLVEVGSMRQDPSGTTLRLRVSPAFRELVVFTPVHGDAFCIEPYTCLTDAINLQQKGVDAGLMVLPPGGSWSGDIELELGR